MRINELIEIDITDNGINFEGIGRYDDKVVFVPGAVAGERVQARVIKDNHNYTLAKVENILVKSDARKYEECMSYHSCGGCTSQHMSYDKTLDIKENIVKSTLKKQGISEDLVESIYGMGIPYNYRNKVQFPVRNIKGRNAIGMFSEKSHKLIEVNNCIIQDKDINEIAKYMFECINKENISCYNEEKKTGNIKNIMVRKGIHTDEIICIFVITSENIAMSKEMKNVADMLAKKYENIKGVIANINETKGNVILGNRNIILYGEDRIKDMIGNKTYYISTNSFFQVNTLMAEVLYSVLENMLKLDKSETVLELYSGVGTIGIFLADKVKEIYGVEIVEDAVKMAEENLKLNNISNAKYIAGDAKIELEKLEKQNIYFDTVIVDPPRKGLDEEGIDILLKLKPKKIGYVSCNPATLARDLNMLSTEYTIEKINLVDMFPWTSHVESVAVLKLKERAEK